MRRSQQQRQREERNQLKSKKNCDKQVDDKVKWDHIRTTARKFYAAAVNRYFHSVRLHRRTLCLDSRLFMKICSNFKLTAWPSPTKTNTLKQKETRAKLLSSSPSSTTSSPSPHTHSTHTWNKEKKIKKKFFVKSFH